MRNLKKLLALVLALVMSMSLMVTANAFETTYDDDTEINATFKRAVHVLTDMGIYRGTTEGTKTFNPKGEISRAEVSALVYRMISTDVEDTQKDMFDFQRFNDVPAGRWYTGYVTYANNGKYIVGDGQGNFYPDMKVTGVQVLAIMLRALGYGKNHEYEGTGWEIKVMTDAKALGLIQKVNEGVLNKPATRETVAQLLWNTMWADKVDFWPAQGYVNSSGRNPMMFQIPNPLDSREDTLYFGWKQFELVDAGLDEDDWGTPCKEYTFNVKDEVSQIAEDPVFETNVRVDECDVVNAVFEDPAKAKAMKIESCYIDGVVVPISSSSVTTDGSANIDPLKETSYLGAQGRETKIYNMTLLGGEGYRIVEKNTYLAQVTKYTKAGTDKNGHPTKATINLNLVYVGNSNADNNYSYTVSKNDVAVGDKVYNRGDLVLVNAQFKRFVDGAWNAADPLEGTDDDGVTLENWSTNAGSKDPAKRVQVTKLEINDLAKTAPVGRVTGHKAGYHETRYATKNAGEITVGGNTYKCADKFFLNHLDNSAKINAQRTTSWTAVMDKYGNVIGLTKAAGSQMIIEGIRWIGDGSTVFGGKAMAQILKTDGTRETVTVSSINGQAAKHVGQTTLGSNADPDNSTVDTSWLSNYQYYRHLYSYTVNEDGTYSIFGHKDGTIAGATSLNNVIDHNVNGKDKNDDPATQPSQGQIMKGFSYMLMANGSDRVNVDNGTIFMVANEVLQANDPMVTGGSLEVNAARPGTQYTVYTGKNAVPSLRNTEVCYTIGSDGFADVVVVSAYRSSSNVFGAYVPYQTYTDDVNPNASYRVNYGWAYEVFKIGETSSTTVWFNSPSFGNDNYELFQDTLYVLEVDAMGRIVDMAGDLADPTMIEYNEISGMTQIDSATTPLQVNGGNDAYGSNNDAFDHGVIIGNAVSLGVDAIGIYANSSNKAAGFAYTMSVDPNTTIIEIARDGTVDANKVYVNPTVQYVKTVGSIEDMPDGARVTVIYDVSRAGGQTEMVTKYIYIMRDLAKADEGVDPGEDTTHDFTAADFGVYATSTDGAGTVVYAVATADAAAALNGNWTYTMFANDSNASKTAGTAVKGAKVAAVNVSGSNLDTTKTWYVVGWLDSTTLNQKWTDGDEVSVSMVFTNGTKTFRTDPIVLNWQTKV